MARSRNIKPGFYKNEDLAECSIWARYIFPGLWMMADRDGRLEDRPKRIKAELLPFDSQDAEPLLRELDAHGFIIRYKIDGASFIEIPKFKEHQAPHYSEKESTIKPRDFSESSIDDEVKIPDKSGKKSALRGGRNPLIPDSGFLIPDSLNPVCVCPTPAHTQVRDEFLNAIRTSRADLDPDTVFQEFRSHYPSERRTLARWRKWIAREHRSPRETGAPPNVADPDSKASIEALGLARGMGEWDGIEQWELYKKRVRGAVAV